MLEKLENLQMKQFGGLMNDLVKAHLWMKKGACTEENKRTDGETLLKSILECKKTECKPQHLTQKKI